jgi:hypothetical protein
MFVVHRFNLRSKNVKKSHALLLVQIVFKIIAANAWVYEVAGV